MVGEGVVLGVGVAVEGARDGGRAEQAVALEEAPRLGVVPAGAPPGPVRAQAPPGSQVKAMFTC